MALRPIYACAESENVWQAVDLADHGQEDGPCL